MHTKVTIQVVLSEARTSSSRRIGILLATGMAQFLVTADYWSVAIAMPQMANDLQVRTIDLQWVITG